MSQAERLARIEVILEGLEKTLNEVREDSRSHREKTDADEAALAALKNKGIGLLIGVGLVCSAVGASIAELLSGVFK